MTIVSCIDPDHVATIVARVKARETQEAEGAAKFLRGDVFKAILTRHKYAAIDAFVLNELRLLDPTIADASCEMRPPVLLVLFDQVKAILELGDEALATAHRDAHARDKTDTQVRSVADALGAPLDPAYENLVERIETVLGEERMSFLALSYTFTTSSAWSKEEFDFFYSFRPKVVMNVAGEDALASGNETDLLKLEPVLRSSLAIDAVALFKDMVAEVPRHEAAVKTNGGDARQYFIENQLSAAIDRIQSQIPRTFNYSGNAVEEHIPVQPIFNQILAILYIQYVQGRGIVLRVRRTKLKPLDDNASKQRYTEQHAGTYYSVFKPNTDTGSFEAVDPAGEDMNTNFIVMDCFSKYIVGTNGQGLDAADLDEHKAALESSNIAWLLLQYAAAHPAFTYTAEDLGIDYATIYEEICMPQPEGVTDSFSPTREQFAEFTLKMHLPNERRPNLANLWVQARQYGEKRDLHDNCQIIHGPYYNKLDFYERINRAIDFQPYHIYTASLQWVADDTEAFVAKHEAWPNAVFGPFVVRISDSAASFQTVEGANKVIEKKKPNQRWAEYKKIHPENAAFAKK